MRPSYHKSTFDIITKTTKKTHRFFFHYSLLQYALSIYCGKLLKITTSEFKCVCGNKLQQLFQLHFYRCIKIIGVVKHRKLRANGIENTLTHSLEVTWRAFQLWLRTSSIAASDKYYFGEWVNGQNKILLFLPR
jgi:hypothetical protein